MLRVRSAVVTCLILAICWGGAGVAVADELPEWWPAEVPVVEGVILSEVDPAEDKGLPSVSFKVPVEQYTMEALIEHYRTGLEAAEWRIDSERDTGLARSLTATKLSLDRRVIVTAKKPGSLFNRDREHILLEVIVYSSIPTS